MKKEFCALISGGKDSIYTIHKLVDEGYKLSCLVYLKNVNNIDSYMYQTVGHEIVESYSICFNVPIVIHETKCNAINKNLEYHETLDDEVEDLISGIKLAKKLANFQFLSTGAILSNYQKNRVDYVAAKVGITHLAPLWGLNQETLLDEMVQYGIKAVLVKVASSGLTENCINMDISLLKNYINKKMHSNDRKWFNFCGEGGEYETLVVDAPLFRKKIKITEYQVMRHPDEELKENNVFFMKICSFITQQK